MLLIALSDSVKRVVGNMKPTAKQRHHTTSRGWLCYSFPVSYYGGEIREVALDSPVTQWRLR